MTPRWLGWLPVLMYHRVVERRPPDDLVRNCLPLAQFEDQMSWLERSGYRTLSLAEVEAALQPDAPVPPRRSVVITFDDGYQDTYQLALPVLRRRGFRAAVFVVAGAIGGSNTFDREFGVEAAPMMTAGQLRELLHAGFEVGAHTMSHPGDLRALADPELECELGGARRGLEAILDAPVRYFSYPRSRHDKRLETAVLREYRVAFGGEGRDFRPGCVSRVIAPLGGPTSLAAHLARRRLRSALGRAREAGLRP